MKHVTFRPETERRHYGRILFEEYLHIRHRNRKLKGSNIFIDSLQKNQIQEKTPIGIEKSIFCIAIPAGLAVWAGLIYFLKFLFF